MSAVTSNIEAPAIGRDLGYKPFTIGKFRFERDEYFAHIFYPMGRHLVPIDAFLRALMRDVAWGFLYGTVNFGPLLSTLKHSTLVRLFSRLYNPFYLGVYRAYGRKLYIKRLNTAI